MKQFDIMTGFFNPSDLTLLDTPMKVFIGKKLKFQVTQKNDDGKFEMSPLEIENCPFRLVTEDDLSAIVHIDEETALRKEVLIREQIHCITHVRNKRAKLLEECDRMEFSNATESKKTKYRKFAQELRDITATMPDKVHKVNEVKFPTHPDKT